jgi:hypothetical protein
MRLSWTIIFLLGSMIAAGREPYRPVINPADFQTRIDNRYFPLIPGTVRRYRETGGGETRETEITVTHELKQMMGVQCVAVHDVVTQNGALKEETWEWYAQDKRGNAWLFGEATQEYKPGGRISREGSWEAGVDGAQPGVIMPAEARPGAPYRRGYLAGKAEDMGQIMAVNESVTVPAGDFTGCLLTKEWSMLESGTERKWYARGIGMVRTEVTGGEVAVLVSIRRP